MSMSPDPRRAEAVTWQAQVRAYRRRIDDPVKRPLKIFTLDSATARVDGAVASVEIPWEPLSAGPVGALFEVDSEDGLGVDLDDPRLLIRGGLDPSVSDRRFHQQMVYAVASRIYDQFHGALGRVIAWGFDASSRNGRLLLRPHASDAGANACYEKDLGRISFGFCQAPAEGLGRSAPKGDVFICLSHDVIAHEFTHALFDGLRSHLIIFVSGDVFGFHEGLADLVAVF